MAQIAAGFFRSSTFEEVGMSQVRNAKVRRPDFGSRWIGKLAVLLVPVLLLWNGSAAYAQLAGKGSIRGTVTDQSGAVIPGAVVVATNVATGEKQTTTTTSSGDFLISEDAGDYTVVITMKAFKTLTQENVHVNSLESTTINATLQTGNVTEEVTVTAAPPLLDTTDATLGITMQQEMYSALPVLQNGSQRRATDFASLMPGVQSNVTNGGLDTNTGIVNGSGSRGAVSGVYIDGVPITSVAGAGDPRFVWTAIAVDAVDQFQVQTTAYPAIYEGQGVQNYTVKRGTNKIHGNLFEFFRNTALDTWGFTAPFAKNPLTGKPEKPVEHQNEYGLFLGFPLLKDKLFLFGGYDGYRYLKGPNYQYQTNPTVAMMNGDFTNDGGYPIYDPKSTKCTAGSATSCTAYTRSGFSTPNVIPKSYLSPTALTMQSFLPPLTNNNVTNNYLGGLTTGLNNWTTANRVDFNLTPVHSISGIIAFGRQATTGPSAGNNQAGIPFLDKQNFFVKTKVIIFEDNYTITSHVVNQLKYGYGRYDSTGLNPDVGDAYSAAVGLGIGNLPAGQTSDSFPVVKFSGNSSITQWGGYTSNRNAASGYVLLDNLNWNVGPHNFVFGGQIAWMQYNFASPLHGNNPLQLTFSSGDTATFKPNSTTTDSTTGIRVRSGRLEDKQPPYCEPWFALGFFPALSRSERSSLLDGSLSNQSDHWNSRCDGLRRKWIRCLPLPYECTELVQELWTASRLRFPERSEYGLARQLCHHLCTWQQRRRERNLTTGYGIYRSGQQLSKHKRYWTAVAWSNGAFLLEFGYTLSSGFHVPASKSEIRNLQHDVC